MSSAKFLAVLLVCAACAAGCASPPAKKAGKPAATKSVKPAPKKQAPAKTAAKPAPSLPAAKKAPAATPAPAAAAETAPLTPAQTLLADLDPTRRYAGALELLKTNQLQDAEQVLLAVAQQTPKNSGPHTNLGILYARSQRPKEALAAFNKAVAADARNAAAHNWLGILYRESGDYARAEQAYLKALELDPKNTMARLNLGILYDLYLKRPANALTQYRLYRKAIGPDDLKTAAWIAALESQLPKEPPASAAPAQMPASPAKAKPAVKSVPKTNTPPAKTKAKSPT